MSSPVTERRVIAAGTIRETEYIVRSSSLLGPVVAITAGIHGNEPAGIDAAEQIAEWPITSGTLVVLPRANMLAIAADKRFLTADLNRNFPGGRRKAHGRFAAVLWQWLLDQEPQWLLDLHEGYGVRSGGSRSVGSTVIIYPDPETADVAQRMIDSVNRRIESADQKFVCLQPPIDGSLANAAGKYMNAHAMILETSRNMPIELRVHQHCRMVAVLLSYLNMI
jgi:predicted deacylase